jgi:predicted ArsR family transcriptional regulator
VARNASGATGVTSGAFSAQVSAITSAFGDPTRRAVYLFVRDAQEGVTAAQVAEQFDVHPNVARHHLDKLAAGGYLEVEVTRSEKAGAGRPSKRFHAVDTAAPMQFPVRSDDLVLSLLGEAIERLPRHEAEATSRPGSVRCARRCRRSPMRSRPTALLHTQRSVRTSCASSTITVRSATWQSNIRSFARSTAAW